MNICGICKEKCNIPHWLPCFHIFCYKCIRRHLDKRNFCPVCFTSPYSNTDLKTNVPVNNKIERAPSLSFINETKLKKELSKLRIDTSGSRKSIIQRYKEFKINVEYERFREIPRNYDTIVRNVHKKEIDAKQIERKNDQDKEKICMALLKLKKEIKKQK